MSKTIYKPTAAANPRTIPNSNKIEYSRLALLYGRRITSTISTATQTSTKLIYTVPDGKVFLLLSTQISSMSSTTTADLDARLWGGNSGSPTNDFTLLRVVLPRGDATLTRCVTTAMNDYAIPLLYIQGFSFYIDNPRATSETHGCITGYEIDAKLFYDLI